MTSGSAGHLDLGFMGEEDATGIPGTVYTVASLGFHGLWSMIPMVTRPTALT